MGSLPLNPYFNSAGLPPHSTAPSSSSTNWSRHLSLSVRIGWGLAVAPQFANQRWVANTFWEFYTHKPRAARPYLRGPLAYAKTPPPFHRQETGLHRQKTVLEPKTKVQFPTELEDTKRLAGVGAVKGKSYRTEIFNRVSYAYAFGLYANKDRLQEQLSEKYRNLSSDKLMESKEFYKDVVENDLDLTVRLEIVKELEIDWLRSAFKESIGSRLHLSGTQTEEILERFTSQFKDDCKLKLGTKIYFVSPCHILHTRIDDKEIGRIDDKEFGSIERKLLCRSLFDLYIGEDPVDEEAKKNIGSQLASWLKE